MEARRKFFNGVPLVRYGRARQIMLLPFGFVQQVKSTWPSGVLSEIGPLPGRATTLFFPPVAAPE
jgi:hypothetical protein